MEIAVCDDDTRFAGQLEGLLTQYCAEQEIDAHVQCFNSAMRFLESDLPKYDLVFLDVKIDKENGIETAHTFRRRNEDAVLIFVSAYLEYAPKGYEVDAFRYILKDSIGTDFPYCMGAALDKIRARAQRFSFKTIDGNFVSVRLTDILYFESSNHSVFLYVKSANYRLYNTLAAVMKQLNSEDFLQIHRCYYVNMRNVAEVKGSTVVLTNGEVLIGSRQNKKAIQEKFLSIQGEC